MLRNMRILFLFISIFTLCSCATYQVVSSYDKFEDNTFTYESFNSISEAGSFNLAGVVYLNLTHNINKNKKQDWGLILRVLQGHGYINVVKLTIKCGEDIVRPTFLNRSFGFSGELIENTLRFNINESDLIKLINQKPVAIKISNANNFKAFDVADITINRWRDFYNKYKDTNSKEIVKKEGVSSVKAIAPSFDTTKMESAGRGFYYYDLKLTTIDNKYPHYTGKLVNLSGKASNYMVFTITAYDSTDSMLGVSMIITQKFYNNKIKTFKSTMTPTPMMKKRVKVKDIYKSEVSVNYNYMNLMDNMPKMY